MHPRRIYFVCTVPRSGSWLLAEALQGLGIAGNPREFFSRETEATWLDRFGLQAHVPYGQFLERVFAAGTTPNGVFGAKIHWYQLEQLVQRLREWSGDGPRSAADLVRDAFPGVRYIWLTRRHKVRQAISYYRADQTGDWWSIDGFRPPGSARTGREVLDLDGVDRLLRVIIGHEARWVEYFEACGAQPLVVAYEDLASSYESTIRAVLRYLDVPAPADLQIGPTRLRKQADERTEEWTREYISRACESWAGRPRHEPAPAGRGGELE